jgi:hypothetical protein
MEQYIDYVNWLDTLVAISYSKSKIYKAWIILHEVTLGKFFSRAAIIAIVEEQTNAAELDRPDPESKLRK